MFLLVTLFVSYGTVAVRADIEENQVETEENTVELNKTKATLCKKESLQLEMFGTDETITWKSSKPSVAKVTSDGRVIAKAKGVTIISATVNEKTYKCKVKVRNHVFKKATCTKKSYCKFCNMKKGKVRKHKYKHTVVAPTKKRKGYTYHKCTYCKKSYKDKYKDYNPTSKQVYKDMIALKSKYKEGMTWTNENSYVWKGQENVTGFGCAGFAFILSDAAFGYLPAREHSDFNKIRVGDILWINYGSHFVIVLEKLQDGVIVAEGNFNYSIHWGRYISYDYIKRTGNCVFTRYQQ